MTRGELIRKARKKRKLTQEQLAQKCEMATITIRQYETGKRTPQAEQLAKIARALNVSVADLWGEDDGNFMLNKNVANFIVSANKAVLFVEDGEVTGIYATKDTDDISIDQLQRITVNFGELNEAGQKEAVIRISELAQIPKYRSIIPIESLFDSDATTDTPATEKPPEGQNNPADGK